MSYPVPFNPPIDSTFAASANPSTSTLLAELESTNFGYPSTLAITPPGDRLYAVNIYIGASTLAYFAVEHATSTGLGSTAITSQLLLRTASGQHSQFLKVFKLGATDRIRVRPQSTATGTYEAFLSAQELA